MKLDVKAMAFAGAVLWGGCVLLMGLARISHSPAVEGESLRAKI